MTNPDYDFSFDMAGIDRQALLEAAATEIDAQRGHLGEGGKLEETPEGRQTREYKNDQALLPSSPGIYKITDQAFLASNLKAPVRFTELSKRFNFYWISIPIGLMPERHWGFNLIEARVEFNKGEPPESLPKAYQILPNVQFQTLAKSETYMKVRLDENFELAFSTGTIEEQLGAGSGKIDAGVKTIAKAGLGFDAGPFVYHIKRAKIQHNTAGMEWVKWRLDGAEFFEGDNLELIVVAQVPKSTQIVTITAALQACRYFNYLGADWTAAVKQLGKDVLGFFKAGMPLRDDRVWSDVTRGL